MMQGLQELADIDMNLTIVEFKVDDYGADPTGSIDMNLTIVEFKVQMDLSFTVFYII